MKRRGKVKPSGQVTVRDDRAFLDEVKKADRAAASGDFHRAAELFGKLVRQRPNDFKLRFALGRSLHLSGRPGDAEQHLRKVLRKSPGHMGAALELATLYSNQDRFAEAERVLDSAMLHHPGQARPAAAKAQVLSMQRRHEEAMGVLEPFISRAERDVNVGVSFAVVAPQIGRVDDAIEYLEAAVAGPDVDENRRVVALFALAALYDGAGKYDRAFEVYREANERKGRRFDPDAFEKSIDELIRKWNARSNGNAPIADDRAGEGVVFILGMPRSGTTLIEQILDCHPEVRGGGELPFIERAVNDWLHGFTTSGMPVLSDPTALDARSVRAKSQEYIAEIQRLRGEAKFVTDKMPLNCLHLGAISRMLPAARAIHCRRNPIDTCLSCYFRDFIGGHNSFAYNLEHLGRFYRQYDRVMNHWRSVLDLPILDVAYEELVADAERITRAVLEFLGLEWSDVCLRFHESKRVTHTSSREQVRKPIYTTSVDRYKHYEAHLQPLIAALESPPGRA